MLVGIRIGAVTVENSMTFFKNLGLELPYDTAVLFLGVPKIKQNTNLKRFIATSFTIAKIQKQPKCSLTGE